MASKLNITSGLNKMFELDVSDRLEYNSDELLITFVPFSNLASSKKL